MAIGYVFLGAPGSGKGTQAKKLADAFGFLHISTGDLIRDEIRSDSDLGREVKPILESGKLVSDTIILNIIRNKLKSLSPNDRIIFDGFPRTFVQAEGLQDLVTSLADFVLHIFYFETSLDVVLERITGRQLCSNCGAVFHKKFSPSASGDSCDKCGGALYIRSDDTEAVVIDRFNIFLKSTEPLLSFYKGKVTTLDANKPIDNVFSDLSQHIVK